MRTPGKTLRLLFVLPATLGGCARTQPDGPPDLRVGRDECAHCGMLLSEDRCAAALLIDRAGSLQQSVFDDLGCLMDFERELPADGSARVVKRFARDYQGSGWLTGDRAVIVCAPTKALATPMGSGMVACADKASAQAVANSVGGELADIAQAAQRRREAKAHSRPGSGG